MPPLITTCRCSAWPAIFGTTPDHVPATAPYVPVDDGLVKHWREELGPPRREGGSSLRIGIAWQGNPIHRGDRLRSVPLVRFSQLTEVEGVELVSLQKGNGADQVRAPRGGFRSSTLKAVWDLTPHRWANSRQS